jgi:hypothetical protein
MKQKYKRCDNIYNNLFFLARFIFTDCQNYLNQIGNGGNKMKKFIIMLTVVMFISAGLLVAGHGDKKGHGPGLKHYIAAQEALASDNFDGAKKALTELAGVCKADHKPMIEKAISSGDINVLRKTFKMISTFVAEKGAPEGYGVAFCPMADNNTGAYWVQKKGQIINPYFGASMLRCGSFKEYKASKKDAHKH